MKLKKADIILILALLLLAFGSYIAFSAGSERGAYVEVRADGITEAVYLLSENGEYPLNGGSNILVIEDGKAWIREADCPDKLCIKQGKISLDGQCIVCLPNKLSVTARSATDDGIDIMLRPQG